MINLDRDQGITDEGILPLAHFLDVGGADAVAVTLESNGRDDPYPAVYLRRNGSIGEHTMPPDPLLQFEGPEYERQLRSILDPVLTHSGAAA